MIRKATIEDLEQIQQLNQLLFIKEEKDYDSLLNVEWPFEKEGEEFFKKAITDNSRATFVAEEDGKIVGYLAGKSSPGPWYKDHCISAELDTMFILNEYRSSGIGSRLVKSFVVWAKDAGAKRIEVRASSGNDQAINFYKKNGFEDFDTILKLDL